MRYEVKAGFVVDVTGVLLQPGDCMDLPEHIAWEIRHKLNPVEETAGRDYLAVVPADAPHEERVSVLEGELARWLQTGLEQERVEVLRAALDEERRAADGVAAWSPPPKRTRAPRLTTEPDKD